MSFAKLLLIILILNVVCLSGEDRDSTASPSLFVINVNPVSKLNLTNNQKNYFLLSSVTIGILSGTHIVDKIKVNDQLVKNNFNYRISEFGINSFSANHLGRFWSANFIAHLISAGYEGAEIDLENSALISGVSSFLLQQYFELNKFSSYNDYDFNSVLFDFAGSVYAVSQYYIPALKDFQPRISYDFFNKSDNLNNILNDYKNQTYWMGIRIQNLFENNFFDFIPDFMMISVGLKDKYTSNNSKEVIIALDIDYEALPLYGKFWQFIKNTLNYFHFPLPGISLSPGLTFHLVTF